MKITDLFASGKITLSFEVFPPKTTAAFATVKAATEKIAALAPDYMSVTYGAGGSNSKATLEVAQDLMQSHNTTIIAHLTCIGTDRASIDSRIAAMRAAGIENVLALRGDVPASFTGNEPRDFTHANELMAYLGQKANFCIGGACYPEVHPESANQEEDLRHLKLKVEAGCDFLVTQMFFDNNVFYNFLYKAREAGITVPIVPGIMPITRAKQIGKSVQLSGSSVPTRFRQIVDHFGDRPEAMKQAGIAYATEQIVDLLANGIRHVHVYSMNNPDVAAAIQANVRELLK